MPSPRKAAYRIWRLPPGAPVPEDRSSRTSVAWPAFMRVQVLPVSTDRQIPPATGAVPVAKGWPVASTSEMAA